MNLRTRVKEALNILFKSTISADTLASHFARIRGGDGTSSTLKSSKNYLDAYQLISYVGFCAGVVAKTISALEWEIIDDRTGEATEKSIAADVLMEPMPGVDNATWTRNITLHYLLDGNIYIAPQIDNVFQLKYNQYSLVVLNPALTWVMRRNVPVLSNTPLNDVNISSYRVSNDGVQRDIEPDKVHRIIMPGPFNLVRGMGIVQQNKAILDSDRMTNIFNQQFFANGVRSNLIVKPPLAMGPKEFFAFKELFSAQNSGYGNWGEPIYVQPGSEVTPVNLAHKDVQYIEQKKLTKSNISNFFGLTPIVSGQLDQAKYDSASEQLRVYLTLTIPGYAVPIAEGITRIIKLREPDKSFRYKISVIFSEEQLDKMFDRGIIKGNEYRSYSGMPEREDVPHLEEYFQTMSYIPVGMNMENTGDEDKGFASKGLDTKATRKQIQIHQFSHYVKLRAEDKVLKIQWEYHKGLKDQISELIEKISKSIPAQDVKEIDPTSITVNLLFNEAIEEEKMLKNARRFHTSAMALSINEGINKLYDVDIDSSFQNPKVKLVTEKLSTTYASRHVESTKEELRMILTKWQGSGESLNELKGLIQDRYNQDYGPYRDRWKAMRIARTESSYAYDQASKIGFEEIGVKECDVVGCKDGVKDGFDCLKTGIPISEVDSLSFPPNHTGTIVPAAKYL